MVNPNFTVKGHIHQGLLGEYGLSLSFGTQCTAIAFIAILFGNLIVPPEQWESHHLDSIVFEGDSLYSRIIDRSFNADTQTLLSHDDIPETVTAFTDNYHQARGLTFYGVVDQQPAEVNAGAVLLHDALQMGFADASCLLATFGHVTVGLLRSSDHFYLFDSHARNEAGFVDPNGSCILLKFTSIADLLSYLYKMYLNQVFNITCFQFTLLPGEYPTNSSHQQSDNEAQFFAVPLNETKFAVQGNIHQGLLGEHGISSSFGTQCTAIAFTAILYGSSNVPPELWESHDLDSIVFEGDALYDFIINKNFNANGDTLLSHDDIPEYINTFSGRYHQKSGLTFYGVVDQQPAEVNAGAVLLHDALQMGFADASCLLATFGHVTVGLLRSSDHFYLFDSHARNEAGFVDPNGSCILLKFTSIADLLTYLDNMYSNEVFNITSFYISSLEIKQDDKCCCEQSSNGIKHVANSKKLSDKKVFKASSTLFTRCNHVSINVTNSSTSVVQSRKSYQDHSYCGKKGVKRQKRKPKQNATEQPPYATMDVNFNCTKHNNSLNIYEQFSSSFPNGVGFYCTVSSTRNNCDNGKTFEHGFTGNILAYEQFIRCRPVHWCRSCDRFLFENQVFHLSRSVSNCLVSQLQLKYGDDLCCTCHTYLKQSSMPSICSTLNSLSIDALPSVISCLTRLEKKMLALVQVCMTLVILPGGQYAEKGLVVNLPQEITYVLDQINGMNSTCVVHFEAGTPIGTSSGYLINPINVKAAADWFNEHNHLYQNKNITIPNMNTSAPQALHDLFEHSIVNGSIDSIEEVSFAPVNYTCENENFHSSTNSHIFIPSNQNPPVSIYEIPFGEEKAFPWLFPNGKFGYTYPRAKKVQPSMYFRHRLFSRHGNFRKDLTYLLHAAISYDKMCLKQQIGICMKMTKTSSDGNAFSATTAEDVRSRGNNDQNVLNSYMFMKNIRGTVAYFRNALYDLLAMFRCLGPPTLFMTLSADDLHWPELGMCLENLTYEEAFQKQSFFTSMRSDPLMTAVHFDRRFSALLQFVINSDQKPLGIVRDYFARVEFQNRGSPHYHMFLWIENVPSEINNTTREIVLNYIQNTVHTHIPSQSDECLHRLVLKLQTHSHSSYCMYSSRPPCRFGFPKKQCMKTTLLTRFDAVKNRGQFYQTFRPQNSTFINAYNPSILMHWRANMDIQIINDANGAAYYVCHYLCKSEPDELKLALANMINTVFRQNPEMTNYKRLWNIGLCVLKNRRVSAQEAAFRLSGLKLLQSSRSVVNLNTRPIGKRYRMLKPIAEINEMPDEDINVFLHNIVDYYCARPASVEMISLMYFASWYIRCSKPPAKTMNDKIYIEQFNVWLRKRKKFAIVRFPTFSLSSDNYYYSLLMLLLPFRNENDLVYPHSTAKDAFIAKHSMLDNSMYMHNSFLQQLETSIRRIHLAEAELTHEPQIECDIDFGLFNSRRPHTFHNYDSVEDVDSAHYHQMVSCEMNVSQFHAALETLTSCQQRAISVVKKHFSTNSNSPLRLFITGGGGVGKSYLLKMIVCFLQLFTGELPDTSPVKCCSPTGTAARHVNGQTIHSLFNIPVDKYLNYGALSALQLKTLQRKFIGVHTVVLDEISMVSDRLFTFISRRLSEIAGNNLPFGGFNILLFGDFFQLRPVCGSFVFKNKILWELFEPIFLRENVRQNNDKEFLQLLNRARVGMLSQMDIGMLKSKLCSQTEYLRSLCIFPRRASVSEHNNKCLQSQNLQVYNIPAENYFATHDRYAGQNCPPEYIPDDDRIAGNLPNVLAFSIGSRVMLIRNLDVNSGLVNGAMGIVDDVNSNTDGLIIEIFVIFDNVNFHGMSQSTENSVAISPVEYTFQYAGRSIIRRTFPLTLCWACTIHKVQGMTTSEVYIDLGSSIFQPGMAYVALSRVTSLQGLHLLQLHPDAIYADTDVLEEYERLREKANQ